MVGREGVGSVFAHQVKNRGPGRITNLTVLIQWPYGLATKWEKSKHLLYLMRAPLLEGSNVSHPSLLTPPTTLPPPYLTVVLIQWPYGDQMGEEQTPSLPDASPAARGVQCESPLPPYPPPPPPYHPPT